MSQMPIRSIETHERSFSHHMNMFVLAALAVALVVAVLALIRESRLRRALQKLLKALIENWRRNDTNE